MLAVGIAIAYDAFFAEHIVKEVAKVDTKNLNSLSQFIKKLSEETPILYGLFSIIFAVSLGVAAAFIRKFFSSFFRKRFKKLT